MRVRSLLAAVAIVLLPMLCHAQAMSKSQWFGMYSSVRYSASSGDLLGIELFVLPGDKGKVYVLFQEMVGEPTQPALIEGRLHEDKLEFVVLLGTVTRKFEGRLKGKTLVLVSDANPKEELRLTKGQSYLQKMR